MFVGYEFNNTQRPVFCPLINSVDLDICTVEVETPGGQLSFEMESKIFLFHFIRSLIAQPPSPAPPLRNDPLCANSLVESVHTERTPAVHNVLMRQVQKALSG